MLSLLSSTSSVDWFRLLLEVVFAWGLLLLVRGFSRVATSIILSNHALTYVTWCFSFANNGRHAEENINSMFKLCAMGWGHGHAYVNVSLD